MVYCNREFSPVDCEVNEKKGAVFVVSGSTMVTLKAVAVVSCIPSALVATTTMSKMSPVLQLPSTENVGVGEGDAGG